MIGKQLIAISLAFVTASAAAQDMSAVWEQTKGLLEESSSQKKNLDPLYTLQPELRWTASLGGTGIRMGADLHSDIQATLVVGEGEPQMTNVSLQTELKKRLYKKVVLGISYGDLGLDLGFEVGNVGPKRNSYVDFGTVASYYGARIQYFKTHGYVDGTLDFELEDIPSIKLTSETPSQVRELSIDGFYAFNRRKFVYTASYGGRIVQRKSVGSWMVAAKYLRGDFALNDKTLVQGLDGLNRYVTRQTHVGAGYSYNWVPLHRDPKDARSWKGLQNLTVNVTAVPMVSLINHIYTEKGSGRAKFRTRHTGHMAFSPTFRTGVCYAWDRYYVSLQAEYNRFGFHGADTEIQGEDGQPRTVSTRGVFYDLTGKVQLNVRF